jgi:hypothetical protein
VSTSPEDLVERQAVIDACYAYAAAVDRTAREPTDDAFVAYADTMTEDCVVDYGPFGRFESRDDWLAFARGLATRAGLCQHLYANFVVTIDGDTARAVFNAQALHFWSELPVAEQLLGRRGDLRQRAPPHPGGMEAHAREPEHPVRP